MKIEWKPIPRLNGYEASSAGDIRNARTGKVRRGTIQKQPNGRPLRVTMMFRRDGKHVCEKVHQLVLEAFKGSPPADKPEGCHNNGNPLDNSISNLRWGTRLENVADAVRHGTQRDPPVVTGERHHSATVTDEDLAAMRKLPYRHGFYAEQARKYGLTNRAVKLLYQGINRGAPGH